MRTRNRTIPNRLSVILAATLLGLPVCASTSDWVYEAVKPEKTAEAHAAALDEQDHVHIFYGRDALYYDWEDADGWHSEVVDTISAPASIAMVLDDSGRPHVVFVDRLTYQLKYARRGPSAWSVETIADDALADDVSSTDVVLCLDASGWLHVGYSAGSYQTVMLKYLSQDASGWHANTVDSWSNNRLFRIAMAIADDGQPHLACILRSGSVGVPIHHAWRTAWGWQTAMTEVPAGSLDIPLRFDPAGRLHAVYLDNDYVGWEGVTYLVGTGGTFLTEQLLANVGYLETRLLVTKTGLPHVVIGEPFFPRGLQHWSKVGGVWRQTMVDTNSVRGFVATLDRADQVQVLYRIQIDEENRTKRAWQDALGWHTQEEPSGPAFDARSLADLLIPQDGRPRFVYSWVNDDTAPGTVFAAKEETRWQERVLAERSVYMTHVGLALGPAGNPHIVYNGTRDTGFGYAWHDATGWNVMSLEQATDWGEPRASDLAVDSAGRLHLGYTQAGALPFLSAGLRYALRSGDTWESAAVNTNRIYELALAIDATDRPHFLAREYVQDTESMRLVHIWEDEAGWHQETVAPLTFDPTLGGIGVYPDIAVDQTGHLHICYFDYEQSKTLRYGYRTTQGWQVTTVDANGTLVGLLCSLALDQENQPHIAYGVQNEFSGIHEIRYAQKDSAGWHISSLDSVQTEYPGFSSVSLALAPDGSAHLAYSFGESGGEPVFRLARSTATGWQLTDLERGYVTSALAIDQQGQQHIAYCNVSGRGNLAYLWPRTVLHGVTWSDIASPQERGTRFTVTLTARNPAGEVFASFTNSVTLSGYGPGFSTTNLALGAGTGSWGYPLYARYHDARTQVIYPASELGQACTINSLALEVTTPPGQALENWTIRMKHTALAEYPVSPQWDSSGWTVVYQGNEPTGSIGWRTFQFSTPFEYNGTDNLLVDFSFNNDSYSSEGQCRATETGAYRSLTYVTDSAYGDPLSWSGASPTPVRSQTVPNVVLGTTYPDLLPVSLSPTVTTPFVNGVWTGEMTVHEVVTNLVLRADDGSGHGGESNPFDVQALAQPPVIVADDGQLGFSNGSFSFNVQGQAGQVVVVEVSTNLVDWQPLQTNTLGSDPFYFSDPDTSNFIQRFYRAVTP